MKNPLLASFGSFARLVMLGAALYSLAGGTATADTNCVAPPAGMVGWWRGEGDGSDVTAANPGMLMNGASFAPGLVGQGFSFNGTNQYVQVANKANLNPTGSFSIEGWIFPRDDMNRVILSKWGDVGDYSNQRCYLFTVIPGRGLSFGISDSANQWNTALHSFVVTNVLTLNAWNYVAATYDQPAGKRSLYVNGVKVAAQVASPIQVLNANTLVGIGSLCESSTTTRGPFNGLIDELSFYNRLLLPQEIQAIYLAGTAGKCAPPPNTAPSVLTQPQSQTVTAGSNVTFTVSAMGSWPLSYQWYFNSAPISGATTYSLVLSNAQPAQAGAYSIVITNAYGSVTSSNAALAVIPPVCVAPPPGLVSWWRGEGDASDMVEGNAGVPKNGAGWGAGLVGQAFSLNGTNQYIEVASSPHLEFAGPFSAEVWINYDRLTSVTGDTIVSKGPDVSAAVNWAMLISANRTLRPHAMVNGAWVYFDCNTALNPGLWYHLAMVYDGSSLRGYVNGQLDGQVAASGAVQTSSQPLKIGVYSPTNGGASSTAFFAGRIDELALYGRALSAPEINAIYAANSTGKCVPTTNTPPSVLTQPQSQTVTAGSKVSFTVSAAGSWPLRYQWFFNSAPISGATAYSLVLSNVQLAQAGQYSVVITNAFGSMTSSNATLAVMCVAPPPGLVGWWRGEGNGLEEVSGASSVVVGGVAYTNGVAGQALNFNGINSYLEMPDSPALRLTNTLTAEFWVKRSQVGASYLINKGGDWTGGTLNYGIAIAGPENGNVFHLLFAGGLRGCGNGNLNDLNWHHCAVVAHHGDVDPVLYIDGVSQPITLRKGIATINLYPSTNTLQIGAQVDPGTGWNYYSKDTLDEVSLYNRALSASEIQTIYAAGSTGKCVSPSNTPPSVLTQPVDQTVAAGSNATFLAFAIGTWPLSYQWYLNGAPISGATSYSLVLSNVQPGQAGPCFVVITNAYGTITSSNATLTVLTYPPTITLQPKAVTTYSGKAISMTSGASGTAPLAFQWFNSDGALPGQTSSSLVLTNVQLSDAGNYWVVATNAYGSATSSNALLTVVPAPVCVAVPTGAVAWWRGESNGLDSASLNDVAFSTTRTFTTGKVGTAFSLYPLYLWASACDDLNVGTGAGLTVEGWIRPVSVSGYKPVTEWNDGLGNFGASLAVNGGYLEGLLTDTNASPVRRVLLRSPTVAATNGVWEHVALTFDKASGVAQLFVNGISLAQTNLGTFRPQTQAPVYVGYRPSYGYYFTGGLDELAIYNRALTPPELQAIVAADEAGKCLPAPPVCAAPPAGLVAWWRGESNALDSVSDNHGVLTQPVAFTNGVTGNTFQFNGGSVRVPASPTLDVGASAGFTMEAWIKPVSSSALPLVQWNNGTGVLGVNLSTYGTLALRANIVDTLGTSHYVTSASSVLTSGDFQHVALTYDKASGLAALYVRGSLVAQANVGSFTPRTTYDLYLGYQPSPLLKFTGALDEVGLYGRALTATEIRAIAMARGAGKCFQPPFIVGQPASLKVSAGDSATFSVSAAGNPLLRYQWQFAGTNLDGATQSTLTLTNVQPAQGGNYSVLVTNAAGFAFSSNAVLTVGPPRAAVRVLSANAAATETIAVPVVLVANGDENALGFSLNFNPSHLTYVGTVLGSGEAGGSLMLNVSQADSGSLGMIVGLTPGTTFAAGTQEVVQVSFKAAVLTNYTVSPISLTDQPIARQLSDAFYQDLPATYAGGSVAIAAAEYEGDLSPRPGGDRSVKLADWVLAGRYATRLEYPTNASEFQRADCAPRATLGDGMIKITDWVQVGRYAVGLDPLTPVGGPTSEAAPVQVRQGDGLSNCQVRLSDGVLIQGQVGTLTVVLEAQGNEAGVGFSLAFDPARLSYVSAVLGSGAGGAMLNVNTNQATAGKLGFGLVLPAGNSFSAGTRELLRVTFSAAATATGNYSVAFADQPVPRDVSDAAAGTLTGSFVNSTVTINAPPTLAIGQQGQAVRLTWPLWATNFVLQMAADAWPSSGGWTNQAVAPTDTNGERAVTLPLSGRASFYRLYRP